jgi:hypothetical protein
MDIQKYVDIRLASPKDDRQSEKKLDADARLRGAVGEKYANQVIACIDKVKSKR